MAVFVCLAGDVREVALDKPGVFAVDDLSGRPWLCYEGVESDMTDFPFDLMLAQRRADASGLSDQGTEKKVVRCGRTDLPRVLTK